MSDQYNIDLNFKYQSVKEMNAELLKAKDNILKMLAAGQDVTQEFQKLAKIKQDIATFGNAVAGTTTHLQGMQTTSANAGMALLNLNYVIRDSPYFFQNFCLGKGTLVIMNDYSTKKVEEIKLGEQLLGVDLKPRNVLKLSQGIGKLYKVHQSNGIEYVCNSDHILSLIDIDTHEKFDIPIEEYLSSGKTLCGYRIIPGVEHNIIVANYVLSDLIIEDLGVGEYFGFIIDGDHKFFLEDFTVTHNSLGVLAVGNNLNPLIDSFARLRQEAGQKSISTFALLRQALVGGAGISIAFSAVVTAIQAFVFWQAKSAKASDDNTESIRKQKIELDKLSRSYLESSIAFAKAELARYQAEHPPEIKTGFDSRRIMGGQSPFYQYEVQSNDETVLSLREQISLMERELLYRGLNEEAQIRLNANKKKENDLNKDNYALIVPIAKSYDDAVRILKEWIAADEKILDINQKKLKAQKDFNREQGYAVETVRGMGFGRESGVRPSNNPYLGIPYADPDRREMAGGKNMKDSMKEFNLSLEMGKILANQLGNSLNQAFMQGKLALDQFLKSLISAIAQMLILKAITNFLTLGFGGAVASVAGAASTPIGAIIPYGGQGGGINKIGIQINGKIEARQDKFVIDFKKAENRLRVLQT